MLLSTRDLDIFSSLSKMFFTSFFVAGVAILLLNSIRAHSLIFIYNKPKNLIQIQETSPDADWELLCKGDFADFTSG